MSAWGCVSFLNPHTNSNEYSRPSFWLCDIESKGSLKLYNKINLSKSNKRFRVTNVMNGSDFIHNAFVP